jgi:hypothetical protein
MSDMEVTIIDLDGARRKEMREIDYIELPYTEKMLPTFLGIKKPKLYENEEVMYLLDGSVEIHLTRAYSTLHW